MTTSLNNNNDNQKHTNTTPQSLLPSPPPPSSEIEESVLKDILDQLEKERIKRAEVEAEFFNYKKKVEEDQKRQQQHYKNKDKKEEEKDEKEEKELEEVNDKNVTIDTNDIDTSSSPLLLPIVCNKLNDVDRIQKINQMINDFTSIQDTRKRNKRTLSTHLNTLFTDLQDFLLKDVHINIQNQKQQTCDSDQHNNKNDTNNDKHMFYNIVTNPKLKELRIKDEISKVMNALNKKSKDFIWNFDHQDNLDLLSQIIDKHTLEFVQSIERLSGIERMKEIMNEMETMKMEIITLRTEKEGYLQLIHALSPNNNAMVVACNDDSHTLPLEVIQLLEYMPWEDERISLHIKDYDTYYQWQVYDAKKKVWVDKIDLFPNEDHCSLVPKLGEKASKYQMENQPLPTKGTWQWIGNWTVIDNKNIINNHSYNETVGSGWTYAEKPEYIKLNTHDKCFDEMYSNESVSSNISCSSSPQSTITRKYRRRTWKRERVLISYPGISRRSTQFLNIHAENAKLSYTVEKLHNQVFQLQNQLNEKEHDLNQTTIELLSQLSVLEHENDKNVSELTKKSKECNELKIISSMKDSNKSDSGLSKKQYELMPPIKSWGSSKENGNSQQDRSLSSFFKFQVSGTNNTNMNVNYSDSNSNSEVVVKLSPQNDHNIEESEQNIEKKKKDTENIAESDTDISKSPKDAKHSILLGKVRLPLISLREGDNEDTQHEDFNTKPDVTVETPSLERENNDNNEANEDITIFESENDPKEKQNDVVNKDASVVKSQDENITHAHESVVQKIIDPFGLGRKISRESIMKTVKNRVKDVESNVQNVKTNVQAIAGRAQTLQKIASQVK